MSTLFSGGRIFDGMGTILDDHAVLVEDQKIQRIAPQNEFTSSVFRRDSVGSITWDDILNVIAFGKSWT